MPVIHIANYVDRERIGFFDDSDKSTVLKQLSELSENKVEDLEIFTKAIFNREKIMSTGLGLGVAFPHVKIPSIHKFFITVGIIRNGVDWDSFDGNPVKIVFMIGGPDGQQNRYLGILSKLSLIVKNEKNREKLMFSETEEDVMNIISKF